MKVTSHLNHCNWMPWHVDLVYTVAYKFYMHTHTHLYIYRWWLCLLFFCLNKDFRTDLVATFLIKNRKICDKLLVNSNQCGMQLEIVHEINIHLSSISLIWCQDAKKTCLMLQMTTSGWMVHGMCKKFTYTQLVMIQAWAYIIMYCVLGTDPYHNSCWQNAPFSGKVLFTWAIKRLVVASLSNE